MADDWKLAVWLADPRHKGSVGEKWAVEPLVLSTSLSAGTGQWAVRLVVALPEPRPGDDPLFAGVRSL